MPGLTDEGAEKVLEKIGFEPPEEKKVIELKRMCPNCGGDSYHFIQRRSGDGTNFLRCKECRTDFTALETRAE
jgi:DNA-directed RNA polymerase subunit M/transcription elongation factor TFIIS